jgi:UDP-arabinose 4-epimerase
MLEAVLVTGGAGYIGSHACKALARAGYRPVVFDNFSRGHREAVRWGPLVEGNLAERSKLAEALDRHRVSVVMHFAAYAYVGESVTDPALYYANNLGGSLSLLEAMREVGVDKIVFSSTCATYGTPAQVPIRETTPQSPVNPYGETKLAIERALHWYGEAYGLHWVSLRYFNAAGADPEGEIGERHEPETHLVPLVLRALEHLRAGRQSVALNLGTGRGHSVREVIRTAEAVSGKSIPCRETARRPGDPPVLVADPGLADELLGWRAQASDLDTIVRTALAWHMSRSAQSRRAEQNS